MKRADGIGKIGRRGMVAEILIIFVLVASVTVLVMTYTDSGSVPNVQKATFNGVQGIKDLLAKAILLWLEEDPVKHLLACNGQYTLNFHDQLLQSLSPYVQDTLGEYRQPGGIVKIDPGLLKNITDLGIDGMSITLENGTVIYDDGNIHSEDLLDKEYFFSVRLPLALNVVEDWVSCDSGNMTLNLINVFGEECFYGKKDPSYPGSCPKNKYYLNQIDRDYITAHAVTPERIATGVQQSIDILNKEFAGTNACKMPALGAETGIVCNFELENVKYSNKMVPYSSERLPKDQVYEYKQFMKDDTHVWVLKPNVTYYRYYDSDLECPVEPRTWLNPPVALKYDEEPGLQDVQRGDFGPHDYAPAMYINTTRTASFTTVIKCTDERATLLGQHPVYTFRVRYGLKQHCGPGANYNGVFMCNGCGLKPGQNWQDCITFAKTMPCDEYLNKCIKAVIWMAKVEGKVPMSAPDNTKDLYTLLDQYDLVNDAFASCGTLGGTGGGACPGWFMTKYDPDQNSICKPFDAACSPSGQDCTHQSCPYGDSCNVKCQIPFAAICCGTPGYKPDGACTPVFSFDNTECFMDQTAYMAYCSAPKICKRNDWSVGELCSDLKCDPSANDCVEDLTKINYGSPCNRGSTCFLCDKTSGICGFDVASDTKPCSSPYPGSDQCLEYKCDAASASCKGAPANVGAQCYSPYTPAVCGKPTCNAQGACVIAAADRDPDGTGCYGCNPACGQTCECTGGNCLPHGTVDPNGCGGGGVTCSAPYSTCGDGSCCTDCGAHTNCK